MLTEARAEADDMRQKAKALLANARLEMSTLRTRRDGIAARSRSCPGHRGLAVPTDETPKPESPALHSPRRRGSGHDSVRPQFRVVLRGYEPAQVDRRLAELAERLATAEQHTAAYVERVQLLEQHAAESANREPDRSHPRPSSTSVRGSRRC